MLPPPPPPSFAQAWSSISLGTNVNTQEKLETMVMQSFFFGGGVGGGGGVKEVYHGQCENGKLSPK